MLRDRRAGPFPFASHRLLAIHLAANRKSVEGNKESMTYCTRQRAFNLALLSMSNRKVPIGGLQPARGVWG